MDNYVFPAKPPAEALAYFKAKGLKPSFHFEEVFGETHATQFTVAKATKLDLLQDIRTAVDKAINDGQTFHQFRKELEPLLKKKGWWGVRKTADPLTGELKNAQLGSFHRLKTIYDTNLRNAYHAGQWQRIWRELLL